MKTQKMPALFLGHGSPMNAVEKNAFSKRLNELGEGLVRPQSILMISAHWMTKGSFVTTANQPKMIYDMYGFPDELYKVQYPALGSPELAIKLMTGLPDTEIRSDQGSWGFDHGTWSVLCHLYPKADIPVVQLSLDMTKPESYHFKLGQQIAELRNQGVMIIASGNIAHNLRQIKWDPSEPAFEWAVEFDNWFKQNLRERNFAALINEFDKTQAGKLSVPTLDHYLPMLYILGASDLKDSLYVDYEEIQNGSISMTSFRFDT